MLPISMPNITNATSVADANGATTLTLSGSFLDAKGAKVGTFSRMLKIPLSPAPAAPPALAAAPSLWLLLQAFSNGCTAMTGVEAVSNGVKAFREPVIVSARRTLTIIIALLALLLAGVAFLVRR